MPEFSDYDKEGNPISTRIESLSTQNHERYLAEHGAERVKGYEDALTDFVKEIDLLLDQPLKNGGYMPNTPHIVRRDLEKFLKEKTKLLDVLKSPAQLPKADNGNQSQRPQQT